MTEQVTPEPDEKPELKLLPIPVYDDATLPANPPRFYVHNDALHAHPKTGDPLRLPLAVKARIVREIESIDSTLEQLHALVEIRGDEGVSAALDDLDIIDAREVARKFFQAFHEKEEVRLGESFGSSTT